MPANGETAVFTNGVSSSNGLSNGVESVIEKKMPSTSADFGKKIREKDFLLDPNIVHLNHGAYGATPRPILKEQMRYGTSLRMSI